MPSFQARCSRAVLTTALSCVPFALHAQPASFPFQDPARPVDERVDDLVGRLTLEEKASQMVNRTRAIPRLNVPEYNLWSEALHGVVGGGFATVFPQAIGLAATFDVSALKEMAGATAARRASSTTRPQGDACVALVIGASMQPDQLSPLKQRYLVTNFIDLPMIRSVFVYAVIVEVFKRYYAPFTGFADLPPHIADMLKYMLLVVAVVFYLLIRVIQNRLTAKSPQLLPSIAIATFALSEAVAIFGLMLFLLTGNSLDFYTFFATSLFLFYLFFPKYDQWERLMAEQPAHASD